MNWQDQMPLTLSGETGRVVLLEAEAGSARSAVLRQQLDTARASGATTWLLSCDFETGGVWAGINDLLRDLLPRLEATAPHLILKHGYELTIALPHLWGKVPVRHPLTETAPMQEKVRNYPIDRAYRVVHGLVNLLAEWHQLNAEGPWMIACDYYDHAGAMATRFFTELMRRRGEQLQLTLLLATAPAMGEAAAGRFEPEHIGRAVRLNLTPDAPVPLSAESATHLAQELEDFVGSDMMKIEMHLPQLIRYNSLGEHPERALRWQARALGLNNHHGFYEDALRYSEPVSTNLDLLAGDNELIRWNLVGNLFGCYVAIGDSARAHRIVVDEALSKIKKLEHKVKVYYVMGMLYARYLPKIDLDKAAHYLDQGLEGIERVELPPDDKAFHTAFMMNGMAFVRHRQQRPAEAIELCHAASELLDAHLHPDQHRLHRSVLQYNIAQVYAFTGQTEEAITCYTAAMEMDPNYSEYYNERGTVYLKMGDLDRALEDFRKAIELSPPYPEVLTNLGQCYQLLNTPDEAIKAYSTSLDLLPAQSLALVGRAQAFEATGNPEAALADYSASLAADPNQPLTWSNRAVMYYEMGEMSKA
ncbi:MAG: tetratricopeptide repeat protein, partial [Pyrinomonadaceae bacterium]